MKDIGLWGVVLLALALRSIMLFSAVAERSRVEMPESVDYELTAAWWWKGCEYATLVIEPPCTDGRAVMYLAPEIQHTPGYPALLVGAEWIATKTGGDAELVSSLHRRPVVPDDIVPHQMVMLSLQMFLDLHLVLLTFLLCRSCAGHLTGLLAALFQCLSPLVATTFSIAPYSMAAFLVTAAACLVIRHTRTNGWFSLFTGTLMLGIACYLHPVCLAFCAVVAVVVSFRTKRIRRLAVVAGTVSACLAPWIMRNGIAAQYWGFSTSAWDSVCWHSAAEIEARRDNVPVAEIRQRFMEEEGIVDERADQASIAKASERYNLQWASNDSHRSMRNRVAEHRWQRARDTFLTHPLEVLGIQLHADTAFWRTGASDVLRITGYGPPVARTPEAKTVYVLRRLAGLQPEQGAEDSAMAIFLSVVVITITLIRHVGIFLWAMCRLRVRMSAANWLCLLIVVTTWILPGPTNGPHFRVIVEPILSAGAAIGWLCLLGWLKLRIRGEKPIQAEEVDAASFAA